MRRVGDPEFVIGPTGTMLNDGFVDRLHRLREDQAAMETSCISK
jgi:hypothetical protein